jgi:hypothetical protein
MRLPFFFWSGNMDEPKEQGGTALEELAAAENDSSNKESRASADEQIPPSKKQDTNQSAQLTTQAGSPIRARKRGGPRTAMGKKRSMRNAVKHGIFAKVVLSDNEPTAQFDSLLQGFRNDLQPEGAMEEILVEKLASLTWRYRRMLIAERAEIRAEQRCSTRDGVREKQHREEALMLYSAIERSGPGLFARLGNPLIQQRCTDLLKSLRLGIQIRGFDPASDGAILRMIFGEGTLHGLNWLYGVCSNPLIQTQGTELKEFDLPPEGRRSKFLEYLKTEIDSLELQAKMTEQFAAYREKMESRTRVVPEESRLDRLLRYSTSLERDFDRTLNQLERLQRTRKGQPVPPALNVNVST